MVQIFSSFITISLILLVPIFLFGLLIAFLNKKFYRLCGRHSRKVCIATGAIGTPIHELSHALMCVLFLHKIIEIKLFTPDSKDGSLGYVKHSFNKKNFYHRVGSFFIGIAPIVVGCLFLTLLMFLLLGDFFSQAQYYNSIFSQTAQNELGVRYAVQAFFNIFVLFFRAALNPLWWVYFAIGMFVGLHMRLSKADIQGSMTGLLFFVALVFITVLIVGLVSNSALISMTSWFIFIGIVFVLILLQSVFFCVVWIIGAFIIRLPSIIKKERKARARKKASSRPR